MFLIPCPEIHQLKKYHVTLSLIVFLMASHFMVEFFKYDLPKYSFSDFESSAFLNVQMKLYERHLKDLKKFKNPDQRFMASVFETTDTSEKKILGSLSRASILDPTFDPLKVSKEGIDPIEYQDWFDVHLQMKESLNLSPAFLLGVNNQNYGFERWVSYLFVHVGFYHLLSNCMFLLLFGVLIESLLGGIVVLLVFLGSGFLAAPIYMYMSDLSQVSLVGASGGVCGLIAFYSIYQIKHKIRFFYWVLPIEGYYGFTYLNSGIIIFLWMLGDLASYFSGVAFLDSVAYAAHLGGFFIGTLCALGLVIFQELKIIKRNIIIS